jgi:hypothetical protein
MCSKVTKAQRQITQPNFDRSRTARLIFAGTFLESPNLFLYVMIALRNGTFRVQLGVLCEHLIPATRKELWLVNHNWRYEVVPEERWSSNKECVVRFQVEEAARPCGRSSGRFGR